MSRIATVEYPGAPAREAERIRAWPREHGTPIGWQARLAAGLFVTIGVWTVLIAVTPSMRFAGYFPRARVPMETVGALTAILVATLAYFRYSLSGVRALLLVAVAFLVLGFNQFVFGVVVAPGSMGRDLDVYVWTWGRLIAGVLLLAGTFPRFRRPSSPAHPFIKLLLGTAAATWIVVLGPMVLWTLRPHLPMLGAATGTRVSTSSPSLTAPGVVVGLVGAALFLVAAVRFSMPHAGREPEPVLLGPALVIAAFAHAHYMLIPTVFSDRISTGDVLRVGFTLTVVVGLMWEIRNAFAAERKRAVRLEAAFAAERERVRELERLDRAHAELLRLVTHELMHPIAAVRGWVVTLRRRWDTLDDAKKLEIVERLDGESIRLRDLAERAPEAADGGALLQPVLLRAQPVEDLLEQAVDAAEDLNGRLRVYVDRVAREASVRADATRVLQVLRNLLANAARYGGESEVELSVFGDPDTVLFEVRDFGPGIPARDLPHVFEQGYRGAHAGDDDGGAGLGLFICKRIVEAHGGSIWATSDPGRATTMSFTVPVAGGSS